MGSPHWGGGTGQVQRPRGGLGTVAASDAGTQAAGGQHGGRNEFTDSQCIDEAYKAGLKEARSRISITSLSRTSKPLYG
jgi:hypothetical protein